jgi:hypothetical protein
MEQLLHTKKALAHAFPPDGPLSVIMPKTGEGKQAKEHKRQKTTTSRLEKSPNEKEVTKYGCA